MSGPGAGAGGRDGGGPGASGLGVGGLGAGAEAGGEDGADRPAAGAAEPEAAAAERAAGDPSADRSDGPPADDGSHEPDPGDPAELTGFSEPVQRAEPVEDYRPGRRWHGALLAAGFVLAAAAIVGGAIAVVGSLTHGFKKPVKVTYKKSAVFSLRTGECLDPQGQSYTLISCDSPHEAEVFATFTLPGVKWPGNATVATAASGGCANRLSEYLNPDLAISLASTYVYPDAIAWQAGTRTVICEVRASSGKLTGSVRGASASAG